MLTLIDTVVAFTVIMLLISFLVKSLTSVVKNHVQYYSQNLRSEVERLVGPLLDRGVDAIQAKLDAIDWRHVGAELLTEANLKLLLDKVPGVDFDQIKDDLQARVEMHKAALDFAFAKRMKNLSLACGTALCLLLNINAFSIWRTLYQDGELRTKFASEEYVTEVIQRADEELRDPQAPPPPPAGAGRGEAGEGGDAGDGGGGGDAGTTDRDQLAAERRAWVEELDRFQEEADFGIGEIWKTKGLGFPGVLYQLLGSLLTGILASVGAPYLHDLLRAIAQIRGGKPKPDEG